MDREYQICKRCIMDTTDPEIEFDSAGVCNRCTESLDRIKKQLLPPQEREKALIELAETIKSEGKGKDYDCIIGVSGGVDSTYTAYQVKKLGLRPLAVHFDNGWDSELAVSNIKNTLDKLDIELYTYVVNWEEFRDIQLSFLKASVANCEIPTDHGITAILFKLANRFKTRFILSGSNLETESIMPNSWGHYNQDLKHLKAVHKRFGSKKIKSFPTLSLFDYLYFVMVKKVRQIPFLNYVEYNKDKAKRFIEKELDWRDYGGKHFESVYTRFFQGYYLPTKFGFDKRIAHLSSLIIAGQMTRDEALIELEKPAYQEEMLRQDKQFVAKKFGMTVDEFEKLVHAPTKMHTDYPSNYFLFHKMKKYKNIFRKIATSA